MSTTNEDRALHESCGLVDRPADGLEMRGEDRQRFLHGLVTCDVKGLAPGGGAYGFVTEAKGHVLADLLVLANEDSLWLVLPPGRGEAVAAHLVKYVIVDRVEVSSLDRRPLGVVGPGAEALLAGLVGELPGDLFTHREADLAGRRVRVVRELDVGVPSWSVWAAPEDAEEVAAALRDAGATAVGAEAFERLRVEAGRPLFGRDYGEENFPQETGLEEVAVSYTKGCYLGQEVVARIHYRGGVNKVLRGLVFADGTGDPVGKAVIHDGRPAGTVTSAVSSPRCGDVGLAILHKRVEAGARVEVDGAGTAEVVEPPFAR